MPIQIYNEKSQNVGYIEDSIYWTQRDFRQGQIFREFGNALALSKVVIKQLLKNNVKIVAILVVNLYPNSFYAVSTLRYFLEKGIQIDYNQKDSYGNTNKYYGKQYMMALKLWKTANTQEEVKAIDFERQIELV